MDPQLNPIVPPIVQEIYHGHPQETHSHWQHELADPDQLKALEKWLTLHAGVLNS